ncbi:MAG: glycosyltransferase family A protein [Roseibium sp.]
MCTKLTISVVVCAHTLDRLSHIRKMVCSVKDQTYSLYSLIIVCDYSDALHAVLEAEYPDIPIQKNVFEKGLSGARNTGIQNAQGDIIAFLDDDAIAQPNWLEKIAAVYDDPSIMAVGGHIEPE